MDWPSCLDTFTDSRANLLSAQKSVWRHRNQIKHDTEQIYPEVIIPLNDEHRTSDKVTQLSDYILPNRGVVVWPFVVDMTIVVFVDVSVTHLQLAIL